MPTDASLLCLGIEAHHGSGLGWVPESDTNLALKAVFRLSPNLLGPLPDPLPNLTPPLTAFGAPVDVILAELARELFFPADDETKAAFSGAG